MTLERWYHRAAIVIWPRSRQFEVWCDAGTDAAIAGLAQMISRAKKWKKADRAAKLEECRQFATQIVESWRVRRSSNHVDPGEAQNKRESIFESLEELNEPKLVQRMIEKVMPTDVFLVFPKRVLDWMAQQGWAGFADALKAMVTQSSDIALTRDIKILRQIATFGDSSTEQTNLCQQLAPLIVEAIEKFDKEALAAWNCPRWDRTEIVVDLVSALVSLGEPVLLDRFLSWQSIHPRYELTDVQIPAVTKLAPLLKRAISKNRAIKNWIKGLEKELETRTKSAPKKPSDWKRESDLSCSCADCKRLAAFLADPTQPEARFPLAKSRRQHLHGVIGRDQCDCTHETLRTGSPQVLVCKKTIASYTQAYKVYE